MSGRAWTAAVFTLAASVLLAFGLYRASERGRADDCLDRGGCWVARDGQCEFEDNARCAAE